MYICDKCEKVSPERQTPTRVVVERREKVYPYRAKANKLPGGFFKDDPGGKGWEIVREAWMCFFCANTEPIDADLLERFDS